MLRLLLPELDGWNAARRRAAESYERSGLSEHVRLPAGTRGAEHVYHLYVVVAPDADALAARLNEAGIGARGYYRTPIHRQPAMASFAAGGPELPVTDELAATTLALPMGTELGDEQVEAVVAACGGRVPT